MNDPLTRPVDPGTSRSRFTRRRLYNLVGLVVVVAVMGWAYFVASLLLEARERAERGRDALQALTELDPVDVDLEKVQSRLHAASDDVVAARQRLTSPVLTPLRPLPVIGRQLASARALAVTAERIIATLTPAVDRVVESRAAGSEPRQRMALLTALERDLAQADSVLTDLDLGPDEALVAPLADARYEAEVELGALEERVGEALTVVRGLQRFMDGSSYVVLAANPAEMSNGGGMHLTVGGLHTAAGELRLDEFRHSGKLFPIDATTTDRDVTARWGHLAPGNDFRKLNLTPRFGSYVGPLGLDMWEAVTGERPDGAIVVDPVVVQALLDVVGPVEVEGRSYDAQSLLAFALVGQYEEFGEVAGQSERRELLASIARAAVEVIGERSWDPLDLIQALRPTAEGRHFLAFSEDPVQQAMWSTMGVDGQLTGQELMVNLASVGGHKLDPFTTIEVGGHVDRTGDGRSITLDIDITNATPPNISQFADGAFEAFGVERGTYIGRLVVFSPGSTRRVEISPELPLEAYGPDGQLFVTAARVEIPPGVTKSFQVEVELDTAAPIVVLPSARIPPVTWSIDGDTWQDSEPRTIEVD